MGQVLHLNTSAIHTIIKPLEGKQDRMQQSEYEIVQYDMAESIIRSQ